MSLLDRLVVPGAKSIPALDGGGIRGVLVLADHFDLIVTQPRCDQITPNLPLWRDLLR